LLGVGSGSFVVFMGLIVMPPGGAAWDGMLRRTCVLRFCIRMRSLRNGIPG